MDESASTKHKLITGTPNIPREGRTPMSAEAIQHYARKGYTLEIMMGIFRRPPLDKFRATIMGCKAYSRAYDIGKSQHRRDMHDALMGLIRQSSSHFVKYYDRIQAQAAAEESAVLDQLRDVKPLVGEHVREREYVDEREQALNSEIQELPHEQQLAYYKKNKTSVE